jgi:acyl dehydratase
MADQDAAAAPKDIDGRITEEDIDRARRHVGVAKFLHEAPFNRIADANSISHFAFGYGDDNPLWHEPDYARSTRWRGLIAPPMYLVTMGLSETPKPTPEIKALLRGLFRGVGKYYSGVNWEWWRPVAPSDELFLEKTTSDVQVRESGFSGGISVVETYRMLYVNRFGEPVGVQEESYVSAERRGSRERGRDAGLKRQTYSPEDIARIDEVYAGEERRGALPRYWEDVNVGDELIPVIKGPLTMLDIMGMHIGWGFGAYNIGPLRYAWAKRTRMPAFYVDDAYGVPDVVQRVHWDAARANDLGLPAPYDYGQMRTCWLTHLVTNWMGDDAWLWKLTNQMRGFNYQGDTQTCTGAVTAKSVVDGRHVVEIAVKATNQRGQVVTPGVATVILPSRAAGSVRLPPPPEALAQRGADMMAEAAERSRRR